MDNVENERNITAIAPSKYHARRYLNQENEADNFEKTDSTRPCRNLGSPKNTGRSELGTAPSKRDDPFFVKKHHDPSKPTWQILESRKSQPHFFGEPPELPCEALSSHVQTCPCRRCPTASPLQPAMLTHGLLDVRAARHIGHMALPVREL